MSPAVQQAINQPEQIMSAKSNLKRALREIDDALDALRRAKNTKDEDAARHVRRAISELEDAEPKIKRAVRDMPD